MKRHDLDPKTILSKATEAFVAGRFTDARRHIEAYYAARAAGGEEPLYRYANGFGSVEGDDQAATLLRSMDYAESDEDGVFG